MPKKQREYRVAVPTLLYVSVRATSAVEAKRAALAQIDDELRLEDGTDLDGIYTSCEFRARLYYKTNPQGNVPLRGLSIEDVSDIEEGDSDA